MEKQSIILHNRYVKVALAIRLEVLIHALLYDFM